MGSVTSQLDYLKTLKQSKDYKYKDIISDQITSENHLGYQGGDFWGVGFMVGLLSQII